MEIVRDLFNEMEPQKKKSIDNLVNELKNYL